MTSLAVRARWALVEGEIVTDRWILTGDDRIAAILHDKPAADTVVDRPDLFVLPGFIDLHNHAFTESLVRGRSEDLSKEGFETNLIYGLLMPIGKLAMDHLSPQECEAIAEMGLMQLMKSGVTTLLEPFRAGLMDPYIKAATRAGLRFYAGPYLFPTPDLDIGADGKPTYKGGGGDADAAAIDQWRALHQRHHGTEGDRIRVTLALHATDTCGADLLRKVRGLADEHKCLATIHVPQSHDEVAKSHALYGRTPTELLEWVGLLGPDVLLAHCLFSTDKDLEIARRHDTTVVNCPSTFARGGSTAAFGRFHEKGLRTVVGTDGYKPDMVSELRTAGRVSKISAQDPGVATAVQLVAAVHRFHRSSVRPENPRCRQRDRQSFFRTRRARRPQGDRGRRRRRAVVAFAREHNRDPRTSFRIADATALPFEEASFDRAVSRLVLQFLPDPLKAVREMKRVVRPGGTVAACIWDAYGGSRTSECCGTRPRPWAS